MVVCLEEMVEILFVEFDECGGWVGLFQMVGIQLFLGGLMHRI